MMLIKVAWFGRERASSNSEDLGQSASRAR